MKRIFIYAMSFPEKANKIYTDKDEAWVDVIKPFGWDGPSWTWVENGKIFFMDQRKRWLDAYL